MRFVTIKSKVKHDSQTFYPDERRFLDDDTAAYFCKHGWAVAEGEVAVEAAPADVKLDVQHSRNATKGKGL
jgi:hypothetical protein